MATPGFAQMAPENEGLQKMLHQLFALYFSSHAFLSILLITIIWQNDQTKT